MVTKHFAHSESLPSRVGFLHPAASRWLLRRGGFLAKVSWSLLAGVTLAARATTVPVPNGSFESPSTSFADPRIDAWQKSAKPDWYQETPENQWSQLTGVFLNQPPGSSNRIENVDGNQAAFLFAVPEVALFQDNNTTDWSGAAPTHAFNATYQVGKGYTLTVGVLGGGGSMPEGSTLELSLYYVDTASNRVTVASTVVTNSATLFPTNTLLTDFTVRVPTVQATNAWAGKSIGVRLLSTVAPTLAGGYWDLDHVRLDETGGSDVALSVASQPGQPFTLTIQSAPGSVFQILSSTNVAVPTASWMSLGTVTNTTGSVSFTDTTPAVAQRFYRAQQAP